jgi:hypothetical protein
VNRARSLARRSGGGTWQLKHFLSFFHNVAIADFRLLPGAQEQCTYHKPLGLELVFVEQCPCSTIPTGMLIRMLGSNSTNPSASNSEGIPSAREGSTS